MITRITPEPDRWDALVSLIPPNALRCAVITNSPEEITSRFVTIQARANFAVVPPRDAARTLATIPSGSLDVVVAERIGGCQREELAQFLTSIARCLAPGGQFLYRVDNALHWSLLVAMIRGQSPAGKSGPDSMTVDELAAAIRSAGMEPFAVEPEYSPADDLDAFCELLTPALQAIGVERGPFLHRSSIASYTARARPPGPAIEPRLIQTLIGEPHACARPRIHEPHGFLRTIPGVHIVSSENSADIGVGQAFREKIFIRQRNILKSPGDLAAQRALIESGYIVIAEFDDDPERFPEIASHSHMTFGACHAVQTSTDALAELIRDWNPNVAVFPNQLRSIPPARTERRAGPVRIFFGALNREEDWRPLMPVLNELAGRYSDTLEFRVVFDSGFFDAIRTPRKSFEGFCGYRSYLDRMGSCDIALLPLRDTRFNRHKSDLKFLECAAVGAVAVASPTVYEGTIEHGRNGFLCRTQPEWAETLRRLIDDDGLRRDIARAARDDVSSRRMLADHFLARQTWYERLLASHDELTRQVYERVPALRS